MLLPDASPGNQDTPYNLENQSGGEKEDKHAPGDKDQDNPLEIIQPEEVPINEPDTGRGKHHGEKECCSKNFHHFRVYSRYGFVADKKIWGSRGYIRHDTALDTRTAAIKKIPVKKIPDLTEPAVLISSSRTGRFRLYHNLFWP
jgi:hypothetical protein